MSYTAIDNKLWQIRSYLMQKHGVDAADRMMDPLVWYITTDRASLDFLRRFLNAKAFIIGRQLAKGGSSDECIKRIDARI